MDLRQYQQEAIDTIMEAFRRQENYILLQAATGAGKTIILSHLIKHCQTTFPNIKILILAHRAILIEQTVDKLKRVWPEAKVGIACASVQKDKDVDAPVVVASIQSIYKRDDLPVFNMVIVDECHRLPEKQSTSMYGKLLHTLLKKNDRLRILGLTATPYRLGQGYIHGGDCKEPKDNWFEDLHVAIDIKKLQTEGYLCKHKHMLAIHDIPDEINSLKVKAGEYDLNEACDLLSAPKHLMSIVKNISKYAPDRSKVVLFCTTIKHAEKVREIIEKNLGPCGSIHSEMTVAEREKNMQEFHYGDTAYLTNVNVLTEGWDFPELDCVVLCRPTKSTSLYVQMVGRGLRTANGKEDCLVLDLVGCYNDHGSVRDPKVSHSVSRREGSEAPEKICDECQMVVPLSCMVCPYCGHEFKKKDRVDNSLKKMVQVDKAEKFYCEVCKKQKDVDELKVNFLSNSVYSASCQCGCEIKSGRFQKLDKDLPLHYTGHHMHKTVSKSGNPMQMLFYYGRHGLDFYKVTFFYVLNTQWGLEKYIKIKDAIPAFINVRFDNGFAKARGL